ncbi:unnamed protein product, partial [Prorocentrum cordatum]
EVGLKLEHEQKRWAPPPNEFQWVFDGTKIRSKLDQRKCASVREGIITDGSNIIMWNCGEGKEFGWTVDGDFIKLSSNPRYCMSVREGKAGDGSDIILWNCADSTEFKWNIDEASGTVGFRADPKYKLSVRGGR